MLAVAEGVGGQSKGGGGNKGKQLIPNFQNSKSLDRSEERRVGKECSS